MVVNFKIEVLNIRLLFFYSNEHQRQLAEQYICELQDSFNADKAIATKILPASTFYEAEAYHQDFYKKEP